MTDNQTMKVGELELRKTDAGWQYLSEGICNDPDLWCDAKNVLGPFGGSGVESLLDELWAAKEQAAQNSQKVCRNCRWWGREYEGCCDFIDTTHSERVANTTGCTIVVKVLDDSGLDARLKTAPNFSCPNFQQALDEEDADGLDQE